MIAHKYFKKSYAAAHRFTMGLGLLLLVASFDATAQGTKPTPEPVPDLMNYQGLVYLEDGSTDITGTYDMEFYLFYETTGGTAQWGEKHENVQVSRGVFSVLLGAGAVITGVPRGTMADVFVDSAVYIEIVVNDDFPLRIRQRFTSTPHAFSAQHAVTAVHGVPAGTVMPFAGPNVPYGWLPCNGATYAETDYPALFAAIGTVWGGSAGSFLVPQLGGRIPVGVDAGHGLGVRRGAEKHTLTIAEMPSHTHSFEDKAWSSTLSITGLDSSVPNDQTTNTLRTTGSAGSGNSHNNMQPVATVRYIIKW